MKHRILKLLAVIMAICCALCGCAKEEIDPEKYKSYKCYDYHLAALETEEKSALTEFLYYDDYTDQYYTRNFWVKKIACVSDDQFIYAKERQLYGALDKIVMQNPDNYVDVWNDWSVAKIEFYYISLYMPIEQNGPAVIPTGVIDSTSEAELLKCFKSFVADCEKMEYEKLNIPNGYGRVDTDANGHGVVLYIRVFFNESENIVWDANVESYYSSEKQDRIIYIDGGKECERIASPMHKDVNIDDYQLLYDWISNAIVNFDLTV